MKKAHANQCRKYRKIKIKKNKPRMNKSSPTADEAKPEEDKTNINDLIWDQIDEIMRD